MKADRRFQSGLLFVVSGLLAACSSGSSLTTPGSQSMSSAYQRGTTLQDGDQQPLGSTPSCEQMGQHHDLASTEVTIRFRPDCGVTGDIRFPAVTNLSSPPQYEKLCESPNPVYPRGQCASSISDQGCQQANSTFWYMTLETAARSPGTVNFASNIFPIKFSSSTQIVSNNLYGLCVINQSGSLIQDDFASGHAIAPKGDTIKLKVVLPASYGSSLSAGDILELFFQSKAASS